MKTLTPIGKLLEWAKRAQKLDIHKNVHSSAIFTAFIIKLEEALLEEKQFVAIEAAQAWQKIANKRQEKIKNAIWMLENENDDRYIVSKVLKVLKKRV